MMQYFAMPFVLGWHAPVWWDFLPALQELQEPGFLQQPQHTYEKSVFDTNIVLQTLETLVSEDSKKQLLLTFALMFVTCIILTICLARWRQTQRRIRFSHLEKPQEMVVMTDDDTMMEDSFDVVDNAEFVEFWKHESELSDDVVLPSEQPQVTTPVENCPPRKDLLNIFNTVDGMAEPNNITLADLLANQNHSPQMKKSPPRQDSMDLNESPRKQYLRKSKVFSDFCVFMNKGVYTLPGRLWQGLRSFFMVNKGQLEEEVEEPRPRYVKAWYAADQIPEHLITESFAEMNAVH